MAKLRHISVKSPDPIRAADEFVRLFGCTIMRRDVENQVAQVTDGYMFVVFAKDTDAAAGQSATVDHFGFTVDDLAATKSKADAAGLPVAPLSAPQVAFHASQAGWRLEFRERGWDEAIASHTQLLELQVAQDHTPKTLQVAIPQPVAGWDTQAWHRVCGIDELPPGGAARVEVGGQAILVCRPAGRLAVRARRLHGADIQRFHLPDRPGRSGRADAETADRLWQTAGAGCDEREPPRPPAGRSHGG